MKKLNLKNLELGSNDLLQREELKLVIGGYAGGCVSAGDVCHTAATSEPSSCCGSCEATSGSWGVCK